MLAEALLLGAALGTGVRAGHSMRGGGVSAPPYASLNVGTNVDDDPEAVARNQSLLAAAIGIDVNSMRWADQVHGADVATVDVSSPSTAHGVDALVTSSPGITLCVRSADCLPVLFADAEARVIGAAHTGRAGLVAGVLENTVRAMESLGARRDQLVAHIGPAVCGSCYEVPAAMADDVARKVPGARAVSARGTPSLDLKAGARDQLVEAGARTILVSGACTVEQPERWFSYRRDGRTGRFAGFVVLT